jgi:hypothetical protein
MKWEHVVDKQDLHICDCVNDNNVALVETLSFMLTQSRHILAAIPDSGR